LFNSKALKKIAMQQFFSFTFNMLLLNINANQVKVKFSLNKNSFFPIKK